jgi:FkbM family methyltransferase
MSVFDILADYRSFCEPRLALAARFRLIQPRYCSLDVRGDQGRTYHIVARPLAGDPSVLREVFIRQGYGAVLSFLPSGRPLSIIDLGAHIGAFTVWLSYHRTLAEAICIEPNPESARLCQFNVGTLPAATVIHGAAGSRAGTATIRIDPHASSRTTMIPNLSGREHHRELVTVPVVSLPALTTGSTYDLLKMDCEGAEWPLLRECPEVFQRFSTIVAELHEDPALGQSHEDFAHAIREMGFQIIPHPHHLLATRVQVGHVDG